MPVTHLSRAAALGLMAVLALVAPALSAQGWSTTGSYLAGRQALEELRTSDAVGYFHDAATAQWNNPLIVEREFSAYAANGEIEQAATVARHLLDLDTNSEMARIVVATEAVKQRRYGAAANELDKLGADSFEGVTGSVLKAWAMLADGKTDAAFALLDGISEGALDDFLVFHRAIMADVAGRSDDAIALAARAYDAEPYVERIVEAYASMLGNAGRFDEAIDVIVAYEARGLTHPLIDRLKSVLSKKRRPGLFAASVQAGAAEMFQSIGVALARDGNTEIALIYLRLAQYLDPAADVTALSIGQLYDNAGRHEMANTLYRDVPPASPMAAAAIVRIASNLDAMGDRPEAIRQLGNIVATDPTDLDAVSVLGDLLRSDSKFADAAAAYSKALAITGGSSPADWRFYYVRGIAYERDKQWPLAEKDFLRALELNPNQPQTLNYLGYSWVDQGVNLDKALTMIKKAIAGSPNDGYIIDSLGWAYYRLGRFSDAVTQLEAAVLLLPTDPEINDHLGDAYWRAGRELEARFQWNIASSVDEEGAVKLRVVSKLKDGLGPLPPAVHAAPPNAAPPLPGDQAAVQ